jgi:hypothetical protein
VRCPQFTLCLMGNKRQIIYCTLDFGATTSGLDYV